MQIRTRKLSPQPRGAYGLWEAFVTIAGREYFGGGISEEDAIRRALARVAREGSR